MKKIYILGMLMISNFLLAQETISFEANEGFTLGTINAQNGWEVTEGSDGLLQNQVISNEKASVGEYSFKNAFEPSFDFQWMPIFGAAKTFDTRFSQEDFSISYDIYVTEKLGSDFEFTLFGVDTETDEFYPVAGFGIENRGYVYYLKNIDFQTEYIDGSEWQANTWVNVKLELDGDNVNYFLNGELIKTAPKITAYPISGFNMLHNNFGADAYYDNIKINETDLANHDLVKDNEIKIFPNPVKSDLNLILPKNQKIQKVSIYGLDGVKVLEKTSEKLDVSNLPKGTYVLKVESQEGKSFSRKFIKQ